MINIKHKHYLLPIVALLFTLLSPLLISLSANAATSAEQINSEIQRQCGGVSADAADRCATRVRNETIQSEIAERCRGMSADAADRCAASTRQSILSGDYNYDGTPDDEAVPPGNPDGDCKVGAGEKLNQSNCGIIYYVVLLTKTLSALVGIVIVVMMAVGGIQYAASRDDPAQVAGAKKHIQNTVMALVFYLFALAFLQWLVPGGVF